MNTEKITKMMTEKVHQFLTEPQFINYLIKDKKSIIALESLLKKIAKLKVDDIIELENFYIHKSEMQLFSKNPIFFHSNYNVGENEDDGMIGQILITTSVHDDVLMIHTLVLSEKMPFSEYLKQEGIEFETGLVANPPVKNNKKQVF